jgi:hypothetical protein
LVLSRRYDPSCGFTARRDFLFIFFSCGFFSGLAGFLLRPYFFFILRNQFGFSLFRDLRFGFAFGSGARRFFDVRRDFAFGRRNDLSFRLALRLCRVFFRCGGYGLRISSALWFGFWGVFFQGLRGRFGRPVAPNGRGRFCGLPSRASFFGSFAFAFSAVFAAFFSGAMGGVFCVSAPLSGVAAVSFCAVAGAFSSAAVLSAEGAGCAPVSFAGGVCAVRMKNASSATAMNEYLMIGAPQNAMRIF